MAVVLPFCGIRYNPARAGAMAELVAPPYDVVGEETRDALLSRNAHNIFQLELPPARRSDTDTHNRYTRAREALRDWLASGILQGNTQSAVYPYDIEFTVEGRPSCRKGFVALVRIEPWETRVVRPHEQTFERVTQDRLRLLSATQAQFSQIFLLYRGMSAGGAVLSSAPRELLQTVSDPAGNVHRLWRITDREALQRLSTAFTDVPLYIADGHHRYTTAIRYRTEMSALYGGEPWRPYHYLMAYLVDASDPGLVVLPTHRLVSLPPGLAMETLRNRAERFFERKVLDSNGPSKAEALSEALARQPGRRGVGVAVDSGRTAEVWWLRPDVQEGLLASRLPPALQCLDVALLHEIVFGEVLGLAAATDHGASVRYEFDAVAAVRRLGPGEVLFFLRPTPAQQVLDVADAGLTMPHKSTFFYPKILTGLVMNCFRPGDHIAIPV